LGVRLSIAQAHFSIRNCPDNESRDQRTLPRLPAIYYRTMLAYLATKGQFLLDAPEIQDKVREQVLANLHLHVSPSEYTAWQNSLGNAMFHALNNSEISDDVAVAVEYRMNGRSLRIDFMIAGKNQDGKDSVVIIELKQWSSVEFSEYPDHVRTFVGGRDRDERHPSYQAWTYSSHLLNFNEYVYTQKVTVKACAFLHNCISGDVVNDSHYENELRKAPVFLKGQAKFLRDFISESISGGDGMDLISNIDAAPMRPSPQLAESIVSMLQGNEVFVLLDEQKTVLEKIISAGKEASENKKKVLIINGGPGTGKSVISINALSRLIGERLNAKYVTPNSAPRIVYEALVKLKFKKSEISALFGGSASFTTSHRNDFDVLIVDEAHRLKKSTRFTPLGVNQIKEIIHSARTSVFFIDEAQKVTWQDIGEVSEIEKFALAAGATVERLELSSQFRCGGSDDYMAWLDDTLEIRPTPNNYFTTKKFDFQIYEDPKALHEEIRKRNLVNNKSRMVAGYCWDWISDRNPSAYDIAITDANYNARWNLKDYGMTWILAQNSIEEVGCIHTCQGLELDYVGVIVGDDLTVVDGILATDPNARAKTDKSLSGYKKSFKQDPIFANDKADELIRNTYRTLMSRGMKGCYVYFTNPNVAKYFREHLPEG
jgi:DUF2075 family protein